MRQNGCCAGAIADLVAGLFRCLAHHLRAQVLFMVFSSNSLAIVTPSLQTSGLPPLLFNED
jgi:hypothetical protein